MANPTTFTAAAYDGSNIAAELFRENLELNEFHENLNYIICQPVHAALPPLNTGARLMNGTALRAAYAAAAALTPHDNTIGESNPATLYLMPGDYDLGSAPLDLYGCVNIIGLSSNKSSVRIFGNVSTNNSGVLVTHSLSGFVLYIANLTVSNYANTVDGGIASARTSAWYSVDDYEYDLYNWENVEFIGTYNSSTNASGSFPMRNGVSYGGKFVKCKSSDRGFGYEVYNTGKFIDCVGESLCFGAAASGGEFVRCSGFAQCFVGDASISSTGSYTGCIAGKDSFYNNGPALFKDCVAGNTSFGFLGAGSSGTYINCSGETSCFGAAGSSSGTYTNCSGGDYSFGGNSGSAEGTYTNCIGGFNSFGGGSTGTFTGTAIGCRGSGSAFKGTPIGRSTLLYCVLETGTFNTPHTNSKYAYCYEVQTGELINFPVTALTNP